MHKVKFFISNIMRHNRDTAGHTVRGIERVDHGAVILAVAAGLNNDVARQAEMIAKRKQHVLPGIPGGVFAFRCEREFARRPEDMAMRINRPFRRHEIGCLRIGCQVTSPPASLLLLVIIVLLMSENEAVKQLSGGSHHPGPRHGTVGIALQNTGRGTVRMFDSHNPARAVRHRGQFRRRAPRKQRRRRRTDGREDADGVVTAMRDEASCHESSTIGRRCHHGHLSGRIFR